MRTQQILHLLKATPDQEVGDLSMWVSENGYAGTPEMAIAMGIIGKIWENE